MTDRIKLAEELEAAEGPSRGLDARIHFLIKNGIGCGGYSDAPRYTSSIDAAMTLVPEGWMRCFHLFVVRTQNELWEADLGPYSSAMVRGQAATPALALASAALKAGE